MLLGNTTFAQMQFYCRHPKTTCKDCPWKNICSKVLIDKEFKEALDEEVELPDYMQLEGLQR